jgi:hypothetical protein
MFQAMFSPAQQTVEMLNGLMVNLRNHYVNSSEKVLSFSRQSPAFCSVHSYDTHTFAFNVHNHPCEPAHTIRQGSRPTNCNEALHRSLGILCYAAAVLFQAQSMSLSMSMSSSMSMDPNDPPVLLPESPTASPTEAPTATPTASPTKATTKASKASPTEAKANKDAKATKEPEAKATKKTEAKATKEQADSKANKDTKTAKANAFTR